MDIQKKIGVMAFLEFGAKWPDWSQRDPMIAQYKVLGNDAKRHVPPVRGDRNVSSRSLAYGFISSRRSPLRAVSHFAGRKCTRFLAATCPTKREGTFEASEIELAKSEAAVIADHSPSAKSDKPLRDGSLFLNSNPVRRGGY